MIDIPEADRVVRIYDEVGESGMYHTRAGVTCLEINRRLPHGVWFPWYALTAVCTWEYVDGTPNHKDPTLRAKVNEVLAHSPTYTTVISDETDPQARYDLIPPEVLRLLAITYGVGFEKHGNRWKDEGYAFTDNLGAVQRHLDRLKAGEDVDADDGQPATMAVVFRMFAHQWYLANRPDLDDRKPPPDVRRWRPKTIPPMAEGRIEMRMFSGGDVNIYGVVIDSEGEAYVEVAGNNLPWENVNPASEWRFTNENTAGFSMAKDDNLEYLSAEWHPMSYIPLVRREIFLRQKGEIYEGARHRLRESKHLGLCIAVEGLPIRWEVSNTVYEWRYV